MATNYRNAMLDQMGGINDDMLDRNRMGRGTTAGVPSPVPPTVVDGPPNVAPDGITQDPGTPEGPAAPAANPFGFSSQNKLGRGYLEEAVNWYAPQLQGMVGKNTALEAENFLKSIMGDVNSRGGVNGRKINQVKNEKVQLDDGSWVDLYRDIGGASAPQWHEWDGVTREPERGSGVPGMMMPNIGGGLDQALQGDPMARIQEALAKLTGSGNPNIDALLKQMQGGG